MVWSSVWPQWPLVRGETAGLTDPRTSRDRFRKREPDGRRRAERRGRAPAGRRRPGLRGREPADRTGAPSRSQARAAAATSTVPVAERRGNATQLWALPRRTRLRCPGGSVGGSADGGVEAHADGRPRANREPALAHAGDRRADGPVLVALVAERPPEPARPANDGVDADRFPRRHECPRRQLPVADGERDLLPVRPGRAHALDGSAEALDVDTRERSRIAREADIRPDEHGRGQRHERGEENQHGPEQPPATPSPRPAARAMLCVRERRTR